MGGLVVVRNHRTGREAGVASVKVNAYGTRELAATPVQADGQLGMAVLDGSTTPGAAVAAAFRDAP